MTNDQLTPLIDPYEFEYSSRRNQILAVTGATLALVATGNAAGFSAVALPSFLETSADIKASKDDLSWIASLMTIGCITGNLLGGISADLIGRKKSIMIGCLIFFTGWIVIGVAPNVAAVLVGRILTGWAAGLIAGPVQVYICEIADPSIRGASGSTPSLTVTFGILSTYCLGSLLSWRLVALISSLFPLLVLLYVLIVLPESPTWLVTKGFEREAMKALSWLRNSSQKSLDEFIALQDLKENVIHNPAKVPRGLQLPCSLNRLMQWSVLKPFLIGTTLLFLQAFCGIFPITCYTTLIFRYADHFMNDYLQTVCVGVMRLLSIIGAIFLVNCARRRTLLMVSGFIMFLANGVLGGYFFLREATAAANFFGKNFTSISSSAAAVISTSTFVQEPTLAFHDFTVSMMVGQVSLSLEWVPMTCIIVFMIGYSIGMGIIPWFLVPEFMPPDVRSLTCSIAFAFGQLFLFVSVKTFLDVVDLIGADGTFLVYSAVSLVTIIFVAVCVPETTNLSDLEISQIFAVQKKKKTKSHHKKGKKEHNGFAK